MKNILIICTIVLIGGIFPVSVFADDNSIPTWIQIIFNLYANDDITDAELIKILEFLIENDIIKILHQDNDRIKELEFENKVLKNKVNSLQSLNDSLNYSNNSLNDSNDSLNDIPKDESNNSLNDSKDNLNKKSPLQMISSEIIICKVDEYGYLNVEGKITNNDNISHSPQMMIYATDIYGNPLRLTDTYGNPSTSINHIEMNMKAGQTIYFDKSLNTNQYLNANQDLNGCGIKIEQLN